MLEVTQGANATGGAEGAIAVRAAVIVLGVVIIGASPLKSSLLCRIPNPLREEGPYEDLMIELQTTPAPCPSENSLVGAGTIEIHWT